MPHISGHIVIDFAEPPVSDQLKDLDKEQLKELKKACKEAMKKLKGKG